MFRSDMWRVLSIKHLQNIILHSSPFLTPDVVESLPITGLSRESVDGLIIFSGLE